MLLFCRRCVSHAGARLDPGVLAGAAHLHRQHARIGSGGHAGQAARHHDIAVRRGAGEHAQADRARLQAGRAAILPHRRLRQAHQFLGDVVVRIGAQIGNERRARLAVEILAEHGRLEGDRAAWLDHQAVEPGDDGFQRGRFAAPPGGHRGHLERLAQQALGQRRQEAEQGARLEQARTEAVGDHHIAAHGGLGQAGHAEQRVLQLERIARFVVDPAHDHVHPVQSGQRLDEDDAVAHRQVAAFDQRQAQVARQVGLLVIAFAARARREQHDQRHLALAQRRRLVAMGRAEPAPVHQAVVHRAEERRHRLHLQFAQQVGEGGCDDGAVFECVAGARRRLRAVGHHPPAAIGRARQVDRVEMQRHVVVVTHAVARAQEARMAMDQRRRQQAFAQHRLLAIHVAQNLVEQRGALDHGRFDAAPFLVRQDQRQHVQVPLARPGAGIGQYVVADAVFAHLALHHLHPLAHHVRCFVPQVGEHRTPVRARRLVGAQHFIETIRRSQIVGKQLIGHWRAALRLKRMPAYIGCQRKSRVIGKLGLRSSLYTVNGPGV